MEHKDIFGRQLKLNDEVICSLRRTSNELYTCFINKFTPQGVRVIYTRKDGTKSSYDYLVLNPHKTVFKVVKDKE